MKKSLIRRLNNTKLANISRYFVKKPEIKVRRNNVSKNLGKKYSERR